MTYIVTDACVRCKYMDCVEVCPVDCFYEGENFLVIHPDECIDCGVCEPECPVDAIKPDTQDEPDGKWLKVNTELREGLAEHYRQGHAAGGRRRLQGREGQVREILQPGARNAATDACRRSAASKSPKSVVYMSQQSGRACTRPAVGSFQSRQVCSRRRANTRSRTGLTRPLCLCVRRLTLRKSCRLSEVTLGIRSMTKMQTATAVDCFPPG